MNDKEGVVLLVDDEENITALFEAWLEDRFEVRTANDGKEALSVMDDDVDVVLLDRRMPRLSGDEVLTEMRNQGYDARVAMVTAVEPDFDVVEMGFDDYLTKPVEREELEGITETLLARTEYESEVRRYFSLAAKKAALESSKPMSKLSESSEYNELVTELEEMGASMDTQLDSEDDFVAAFQDL